MTKKIYLMLLSVFLSVTYLSAQVVQTVNVPSAGGLATAIGSNLKTVTDLTLTGTINATDFNTIKQMTALKNLNMSQVAVVDNTIPAYAFQRRVLNSLVLPEGLETISRSTFSFSSIKETLILPSGLKTIGDWAFEGMKTPISYSKALTNLESLGVRCFSDYSGLKELDFSKVTNPNLFSYQARAGAFSGYGGHVIYPEIMETVTPYSFCSFAGTVSLPKGLKTLGSNSFEGANMLSLELPEGLEAISKSTFSFSSIKETLILPSGLKTIGDWAFEGMKTPISYSKALTNLESLGVRCFSDYSGLKELDFSKVTNPNLFSYQARAGAFSGYGGHVIYPEIMETVTPYSFCSFAGTVSLPKGLKTLGSNSFEGANMLSLELPEGLEAISKSTFSFSSIKETLILPSGLKTIGDWAFERSTITSIDLPSSVTSIGANAFNGASKLSRIISNNPTPPTLGANVFYGVNKETTALEVPSESINLYGSAAQWKDFLNISGRIPSKVELLYHIGIGHVAGGIDNMGVNTDEYGVIEVPYEAVRIGEYYWMTNNFNHEEPLRKRWTMTVSGDEADRHMTQEDLDTYFQRMHANESQFQVDITDYNKTFGNYYSPNSVKYMDNWAKIFENGSTQNNDQWGLPQMKDFRQLIGMSPFMALNTTTELTVHDAMTALCAGRSRYPILKNKIMDNCGGTWNYWADYGDRGGDKYGFGFTPSGNRSNGVYTQRFMAESSPNVKCYDDYVQMDRGELIQLFHRGQLAGSDSYMSFHEVIDTRQWQQDSHWLPIRWCRPLSNEELGYRLYLNINNIDKKSNQWTSLANGDEIPLLNYMRNNNIPTDQTSILKLGLSETAPEGYIELPHGYIRGFYVQYLLDNPNTNLEVSNIMKYAYGVQDEALEYRQEEGRPSPTTTRSLESDDVVVPFKADASVALYPNPVQDVLNISGDGVEKVTIYDMSGRQVSTAKNVNTISVSDLSKGTYLVRVLTANGESTHKVIKK